MSQPIIDRSALLNLLEMVDGDTEFVDEMIDTFFADTPDQLATIQRAIADGNAAEVRRAAHSLKSNSSNFGAYLMIQACRSLEEVGRNGDLSNAHDLLDQITAAFAVVRVVLDADRPSRW